MAPARAISPAELCLGVRKTRRIAESCPLSLKDSFWCLVFLTGRARAVGRGSELWPAKYPTLVIPDEGDPAEQQFHG